MLKAVSKSYIQVCKPGAAVEAVIAAARAALTAPFGPVTLEVPVDVQRPRPASLGARRDDLQQHIRQPLRAHRGTLPRCPCGGRRHRQGIAMAIGAAMAGEKAKTVALIGDGGAQLMLDELAMAVEMRTNVVYLLMNDRGYGVIRNIRDAQYGRRHFYSNILTWISA